MAQIIKHRRGSIDLLASTTARKGEVVMATGSVDGMGGPFIFIGETEGSAGAFRALSKIYNGTNAPNLTSGTWGSTLNGTPFYASSNKTLYILSNAGNTTMDLTGNIENNTISAVTINQLNGDLRLDGDLFITGNTYQTGSIDLTGNVVLGGNITIGNQTTDLVVFQGEVSSSILPELNNSFDLGSPTQAWRNLHISGTAYIEDINIGAISTTNLYLPGDLTVSGTTILSGSVFVEDLTEKRLVVAGANGQLVDYSGLTFDNGNLNLSGALEVTNIQGTGSLYLKPDLNDSRDFRIYNTAPSDIHIKGNASYSFFGDDTNFLKIDEIANEVIIQSLSGATVNTKLKVTGNTSLEGSLNVTGTTTLNNSTYVTGLTDNRIVIVGGGGLLEDDANFTFDGTVFKVGQGQLEIDVADGDVRTSGSLTVNNGITINGDQTINGNLTVTGNTFINSNLYISGNVEFLASASYVHISSSVVELDDNIILVNAYSPFERYAGLAAHDSGSLGQSGSLLWDSLNNYWLFESGGNGSKIIGTTAGTMGSEISLTTNKITKATSANTIGDSLLTEDGTIFSYNTNKFVVTGSTGDTLIAGNLTLSFSGGTDNGTKTSAVMFKNSTNLVGFVTTTETTDVLDGVLGYRNSDGQLRFSTVIDGGLY